MPWYKDWRKPKTWRSDRGGGTCEQSTMHVAIWINAPFVKCTRQGQSVCVKVEQQPLHISKGCCAYRIWLGDGEWMIDWESDGDNAAGGADVQGCHNHFEFVCRDNTQQTTHYKWLKMDAHEWHANNNPQLCFCFGSKAYFSGKGMPAPPMWENGLTLYLSLNKCHFYPVSACT